MLSYVITVVICLAGLSHVTSASDCIVDNFLVQANFNITAYAGRWYELYTKLPYDPWMEYYEEFTLDNSTGTPKLIYYSAGRENGNCREGPNNPLMASNLANPAKMYYNDSATNINVDHWVLGTDYTTYVVIYDCRKRNTTTRMCDQPHAAVRSRSRSNITDPAKVNIINDLLTSVCLDLSKLTTISQNAPVCPETTTMAAPTTTAKASGSTARVSGLLVTMLLLILTASTTPTRRV